MKKRDCPHTSKLARDIFKVLPVDRLRICWNQSAELGDLEDELELNFQGIWCDIAILMDYDKRFYDSD